MIKLTAGSHGMQYVGGGYGIVGFNVPLDTL